LNEAKQVLLDPKMREAYDKSLERKAEEEKKDDRSDTEDTN
jgi:DnaJ-class molecular chaperone